MVAIVTGTLQELNALENVRRNCRKFEPDSEISDSLCMQILNNANDLNRVMFTETSSPGNDYHCSQVPSNDSRQLNTETKIGLVTRPGLNANASINTEVRSLNTHNERFLM